MFVWDKGQRNRNMFEAMPPGQLWVGEEGTKMCQRQYFTETLRFLPFPASSTAEYIWTAPMLTYAFLKRA